MNAQQKRPAWMDWALIVGGIVLAFYVFGAIGEECGGDGSGNLVCEEEWNPTTQSMDTFCYDAGDPDAVRDPRN